MKNILNRFGFCNGIDIGLNFLWTLGVFNRSLNFGFINFEKD